MRAVVWVWAALWALCWAAPAEAGLFELFGAGARGAALGGAQAADAPDGSAVWYNPARLTGAEAATLSVSLRGLWPQLWIERGPQRVGAVEGARPSQLPSPSLLTELGVVAPLGTRWGLRWSAGAWASAPLSRAPRVEAVDPATPHFALYQSLPERLWLGGALAVGFGGGLSAGLGAQGTTALQGAADVDLDTASRRVVRRDLEASLRGDVSPVAGLSWEGAGGALRVGLSWRGALEIPYAVPITFHFAGVGDLAFLIEGVTAYTPSQWTLGGAWRRERWLVTADLSWARWGSAPSPAAEVSAVLDDRGLNPEAAAPTPLLELETLAVSPGFVDTIQPRVGVEWAGGERWSLRGGYTLRPSPIPAQVGYASWLDNRAHQLSAGAGLSWPGGWGLSGLVQVSAHEARAARKEPARDLAGVGDLRAGGVSWGLGLQVDAPL